MNDHELVEFLRAAGRRRYRLLVQHHLRRGTASGLAAATLGEMANLSDRLASSAVCFLESIDETLGRDRRFWKNATCQEAFGRIITIAAAKFPTEEMPWSTDEALLPENCELAFGLFQMATLVFACEASTDKARRRLMGIRRSLTG